MGTMRKTTWVIGIVVFLAAASVLFESAGQSSPRPVPVGYRGISIEEPGVQTALQFALSDQKRKNRSDSALTLLDVISAERLWSSGENIRLCLSLNRRGRTDTARVVVQRNQKAQLSVTLWAWGACKETKK